MSNQEIVQNMIARLGQSQDQRLAPELAPHFVDVDEHSPRDLMEQSRALAKLLRFYRHTPDVSSETWSALFPASPDGPRPSIDGTTPPHLGLLTTFQQLYRYPRDAINTITGRHLDFQLRELLRFVPKPALGDHAHLLLELKKGATPIAVAAGQRFSAGKDARGEELVYQAVRDTVINHARVEGLHSVYHDTDGLRFAPIANSADGLGGPLDPARPTWPPFGGPGLPAAHIGFALASPVLRLQEGNRRVRVELRLTNIDPARHTPAGLAAAFEAHLTGPGGWLGPFPLSATVAADRLALEFTMPTGTAAVVDYDAGTHGHAFAAHAPVLQLLHKPGTALRYDDLRDLCLGTARIEVEVDALRALTLENDFGSLNPKKAFMPFGAQPVVGARLLIGCPEALSKRVLDLKIRLAWQGAPPILADWYAGYANVASVKDGITASLAYQDRSGQAKSTVLDLMARDAAGVTTLSPNAPPPQPRRAGASRLFALRNGGSVVARLRASRLELSQPVNRFDADPAPSERSGFITITLAEDFLHADYRREAVQHAVNLDKIVLNEPYTPTVQGISLSYLAQSDEVDIGANREDSFTNLDLQFFHVGCFGQMREHAYLRQQLPYVQDKRVTLLPDYADEGAFLIGLAGVGPGDSASLLMQVSEGSADPELAPQPLRWAVLCDNYWRALTPQELVLDTSGGLRTSGIVATTLPSEASTEHTWMPAQRVWLRATVPANSGATCRLLAVAANAIEVVLADDGNAGDHLQSALPAGAITRLKDPLAAVKAVAQPYAGFGGRPRESDTMLARRAAERLRHRQRCITPWDYERMLLEAFPSVHRVKCIPHAANGSWMAPGNVMLVVIPDLRNRDSADRLQPRVDVDTLDRMRAFAQRYCGMQVGIDVRNPRYQAVRLDFKVRLRPGFAFNYYAGQLQEALVRQLSPWAYDGAREIEFGGRIYRSVLLDFVERLPYVDFVADFKMGLEGSAEGDAAAVGAGTPDAILVSAAAHAIAEISG